MEMRKSAEYLSELSDKTKHKVKKLMKKAAGGRIKRFRAEIEATSMPCTSGMPFNKSA